MGTARFQARGGGPVRSLQRRSLPPWNALPSLETGQGADILYAATGGAGSGDDTRSDFQTLRANHVSISARGLSALLDDESSDAGASQRCCEMRPMQERALYREADRAA